MRKEPFWPWDEGYDNIPGEPDPGDECPACGCAAPFHRTSCESQP